MNFNLRRQRIVSSVLMTISVIVINPNDSQGLEIDRDRLCHQFPANSLCQSIQT